MIRCSVLQCVAVCCSVLQCVAVQQFKRGGLQCVAVCCSALRCSNSKKMDCSVLQCVRVCCSAEIRDCTSASRKAIASCGWRALHMQLLQWVSDLSLMTCDASQVSTHPDTPQHTPTHTQVLEHVSDISLMMHDLCQLVRRSPEEGSHVPGVGALYITTINRTNLSYGLGNFVFFRFNKPKTKKGSCPKND